MFEIIMLFIAATYCGIICSIMRPSNRMWYNILLLKTLPLFIGVGCAIAAALLMV